jgi:hypothetical protein
LPGGCRADEVVGGEGTEVVGGAFAEVGGAFAAVGALAPPAGGSFGCSLVSDVCRWGAGSAGEDAPQPAPAAATSAIVDAATARLGRRDRGIKALSGLTYCTMQAW